MEEGYLVASEEQQTSGQREVLTLWIINAYNRQLPRKHATTAIYAYSKVDAQRRAQQWLELHKHLPYCDFIEYPHGFFTGSCVWLPGHLS